VFLLDIMTHSPTTDSPTTDLASSTSPDFAAILTQAVDAFGGVGSDPAKTPNDFGLKKKSDRPPVDQLVKALLQAEKAAKQQRLSYPFERLGGRWRLCFATGTRKAKQRGGILLGKGFYMPQFAPAYICFKASESEADTSTGKGEINNQIQVGLVTVQFSGPFKYLGKKNLLAFDFNHLQVSVLGVTLYSGSFRSGKAERQNFDQQAIANLPFFAFFWVTEACIAARGRGGGLALWIRDN
jgi:hypothetical protein